MDTAPWLQDVGMVKQPSSNLEPTSARTSLQPPPPPQQQQGDQKRARPQKEQALNCPRCNSTNTKFCYYNNYSLTQPRYFCKTCRRYWTEGGSLRNVPVGGGSRKNKRSSSTTTPTTCTPSTSSKKLHPDIHHHHLIPPPPLENPNSNHTATKFLEAHDLNLTFPGFPHMKSHMELLRSGVAGSGMGPFMATTPPSVMYQQGGFVLQDFRSGFPVDGLGLNSGGTGNGGAYDEVEGGGGGGRRVLFPFEDLSQVGPDGTEAVNVSATSGPGSVSGSASGSGFDQRHGDSSGFWNGVIGGGGATW